MSLRELVAETLIHFLSADKRITAQGIARRYRDMRTAVVRAASNLGQDAVITLPLSAGTRDRSSHAVQPTPWMRLTPLLSAFVALCPSANCIDWAAAALRPASRLSAKIRSDKRLVQRPGKLDSAKLESPNQRFPLHPHIQNQSMEHEARRARTPTKLLYV